ncbi:hypothetical protein GW590_08215 [Rahnella sp. SAP-1]|uniref:Bacteriophage protein n=1 Tax=Rouxiella aceris TaxID=2703884 RepID=A0A848MHQ2_9GAMM|nr:hypothetical protein [Rouxiella aceris]NMP26846.1 hypothetical protein [Rouxiella aceris]
MEFEINGITYRIDKLSAFDQFKVSRKLLPVLSGMISDFQAIRASFPQRKETAEGGEPTANTLEDWIPVIEKILPKITDALAALSDEDANAVIHTCLAVAKRKAGGSWISVFSNGVMASDELDMLGMLQIVGRVVGDSLGNFFKGLPGKAISTDPAA